VIKNPIIAAPPQGFAVASVPAALVHVPTVAFSPTSFVPTTTTGAASLSTEDIRTLADVAAEFRKSKAAAAVAPAVASDRACSDPCGDIKQLQKDVSDLANATQRLSRIVEALANESAAAKANK
jgi:hypothetical protein